MEGKEENNQLHPLVTTTHTNAQIHKDVQDGFVFACIHGHVGMPIVYLYLSIPVWVCMRVLPGGESGLHLRGVSEQHAEQAGVHAGDPAE